MSDDGYSKILDDSTVRLERLLPGPIERVWPYLVEPEKRAQWFAGGAIDPRVGGKMEINFQHSDLSSEKTYPEKYKKMEHGVRTTGEVLRYEPPRLITFLWIGEPDDISEVTFELFPRGNDVLFVITHRRLATRDMAKGVSIGWHSHVGILEDVLNGVEPRPFWTTHAKLEAEYQKRHSQ